jgi:hypothetical protein
MEQDSVAWIPRMLATDGLPGHLSDRLYPADLAG